MTFEFTAQNLPKFPPGLIEIPSGMPVRMKS
jgi:hypothetical protein